MRLSHLRFVFGALAVSLLAGFLHYTLPSRDIVRIVGTDVVREDVKRTDTQGNAVVVTRDVRYIYAKRPDGRDSVYRNEDTGWGWPPYLKFDTANLAAEASDMVSTADSPKWVVIRHYGWRIPMLSMFPNALSMRPATGPDEKLTPWFNILFVSLLVLGLLILWRIALILMRRHVDPVIEEIDREFDARAGAVAGRWRRLRRWLHRYVGL